jgi:hypothetical protein
MTPSILRWLDTVVAAEFALRRPKRVLEIGSLNVNGSARDVLRRYCSEWLGADRQAGAGVDWVGELHELIPRADSDLPAAWADAVVATEAFEHDPTFWTTLEHMRTLSRRPTLWVVTTPANGFPYHGWPNDYYRFTEDAYRDVFFAGMTILDLQTVDGGGHERAVCGMAVLEG